MSWEPTKQVIDLTKLIDNLLAYVEENDADALEWANGSELPEFEKFYTNASGRLQTIFPSLMVLTQEGNTELQGDILVMEYQIVLEGTVSGSDPNQLVADTKAYAKAVESILANIPSATLTQGSSPALAQANLVEIQTVLDIIQGRATPSAFLQIFQTRAKYNLYAQTY